MKKLLLILGIMIFSAGYSPAVTCDLTCPQNPYEGSFSISNLTGANFLAEKIANAIIKKQIQKDAKGEYNVNLQSYNLNALKRGEFKSLIITGEDTENNGVYASYLKFKTLCDYNYIEVNNKENTITFKEKFNMSYAIQFTEEDLNKTMQNAQYLNLIRKVNKIGNSSKLFNIASSKVKIVDDKLIYVMKVGIPLIGTKKDMAVETDLKVRNGEIVVTDAKLVTELFNVDINKLASLINYLNPLDFSIQLMKNKNADMQVKEITIKDSIINVSGIATIDKDVVSEK